MIKKPILLWLIETRGITPLLKSKWQRRRWNTLFRRTAHDWKQQKSIAVSHRNRLSPQEYSISFQMQGVFFFFSSLKALERTKRKEKMHQLPIWCHKSTLGISHYLRISSITPFTLFLIALQVQQKFNAVVAGQCPTMHLEIKPSFSQLKSVFLYIHDNKRLIP